MKGIPETLANIIKVVAFLLEGPQSLQDKPMPNTNQGPIRQHWPGQTGLLDKMKPTHTAHQVLPSIGNDDNPPPTKRHYHNNCKIQEQ